MELDHQSSTHADQWADIYDEVHLELSDPAHVDPVVDVLVELAGAGPALELGIGTGRIALPLASRGIEVHGIDFSEAMIDKLRLKPGGEGIPVTLSDFSDLEVEGRYSLIFAVFNTFFVLLTEESQARCFRNVARHLARGGVFLIEAFVPHPTRFTREENVSAMSVETDRYLLSTECHDPKRQVIDSRIFIPGEDKTRSMPIRIRYAWPADMQLRHRWSNWAGSPFTASSAYHISSYELHD
ncbi:MAG: class I SAM-dependent methyltransferase [Actinomycetia bacterium]|nr:class I SAM-dependent methyltransferase [Actinomycetes bacterium]